MINAHRSVVESCGKRVCGAHSERRQFPYHALARAAFRLRFRQRCVPLRRAWALLIADNRPKATPKGCERLSGSNT